MSSPATADRGAARPPLVRFEDVSLGYGHERVLQGITFTLHAGDFFGLVGPNGAGKSTIVKGLLGMIKPWAGRIVYEREVYTELRFGYVPQRHTLDDIFPLAVRDIVRMARYREAGLLHRPGGDAERAIGAALEAVDISDLAGRAFGALSGGQRQRTLIARALASGANCLVLDEPTDGMDIAGQHAILELIAGLHEREKMTIVFVSHLLNEVANYADRLALLEKGRLEYGPTEEILTGPRLSTLYGVRVRVARVGENAVILAEPER